MNEQTIKFLDQLAEKLGATGQALLQIYTHGVMVEGIIDLVWTVLMVLAVVLLLRYHEKITDAIDWDGFEEVAFGVIIVGLLIIILVSGYSSMGEIFNSQATALHRLLNH